MSGSIPCNPQFTKPIDLIRITELNPVGRSPNHRRKCLLLKNIHSREVQKMSALGNIFDSNSSNEGTKPSFEMYHNLLILNLFVSWQFIIADDGACGLCYEHSPAEGIAVVQLIEHLLAYMYVCLNINHKILFQIHAVPYDVQVGPLAGTP